MTTNNHEFKKRLCATVIKYAVVLCVATAYLIFVLFTGFGIPCLFYEITGLKCAGCGISRMLVSLIRLDVSAAFYHNPFLFITGPFIVAYLVCNEARYVIRGSRQMGKWEMLVWIELILAVAYGLLRNIFPI